MLPIELGGWSDGILSICSRTSLPTDLFRCVYVCFDGDCDKKFNGTGCPARQRVPELRSAATLWHEYSTELSAEIITWGRSTSVN